MQSEFSLQTIIDKMFRLRIIKANDCWELTKIKTWSGYQQIKCYGVYFLTHRISAAYYHELDLNDSLQIACHKNECNNRACWNPEHVYVGTRSSNMQDAADLRIHHNTKKIFCVKGHLLVKRNWRGRYCRICDLLKKKQDYNKLLDKKGKKRVRKTHELYTHDKTVDVVTGRKKF